MDLIRREAGLLDRRRLIDRDIPDGIFWDSAGSSSPFEELLDHDLDFLKNSLGA